MSDDANASVQGFIKQWTELSQKMDAKLREMMQGGAKDVGDFQKNWSQMAERMNKTFQNLRPDDMFRYKNMFDGWQELSGWMQKAMNPDALANEPALKEVLALWTEQSQKLGDSLTNVLNDFLREQYEMYKIWMDSLSNARPAQAEFEEFTAIAGKHWSSLSSSMADLLKDQVSFNKDPANQMRKAFELWTGSMSEMTKEMMRSPGFLKGMGTTLNKALDQQQSMNKVLDERLAMLRMPSKTDVDDIYHGLHELEARMDRQEKLLREIQKALSGKKR